MQSTSFDWKCYPEVEEKLLAILDSCLEKSKFLRDLEVELQTNTSTRLFDWVDHFIAPNIPKGYSKEKDHYRHLGAQFPAIVQADRYGVAIKVESISSFLLIHSLDRHIAGTPYSPYRHCQIDPIIAAVERRSTWGMTPTIADPAEYLHLLEVWKTRDRSSLRKAVKIAVNYPSNISAWAFLEVEREYWQSRNRAAGIQKMRQDSAGMGWANHDHHTFRSSRANFRKLVEFFEHLGFHCRERFYAGREAGWGAQVMENPTAGLTIFLDVDLSPEEVAIDFAHDMLKPNKELGTVGLWCALHGDSILKAGMHHLEAQFYFDDLREDLSGMGVEMMQPFSNFDHLKQSFTKGEMWPVPEERLNELQREGIISAEQADKFRENGALGSHMENLQRRGGYKGFNQHNVSDIIQRTDPRR